jgi:acetoacetyl-CoA synthetase
MHEFKELISQKYLVDLPRYEDLFNWSIANISAFWEEVWTFTVVLASVPFQKVSPIDLASL